MIASQDNAVMISIALLTMTFLPATFISVGAVKTWAYSDPLHGLTFVTGAVQHHLFLFRRRQVEVL